MALQDQLITSFKTGLDIDDNPWLMPPDGFSDFENVHIKHNRIEKRAGRTIFGQMVDDTSTPITDRVMTVTRYINALNEKVTVAFSQIYMNYWNGGDPGLFLIIDAAGQVWNAGLTDYYWTANWQPAGQTNKLYITNGLEYDGNYNGMRYYDFDTAATTTTAFRPTVSTNITLYGAKLVFALNNRLVVLNTFEYNSSTVTTTNIPQRIRWCAYQDPSKWDDTIVGEGDFLTAATGDHIISAQPYKNNLIVFFTNSVWLLYPTGDPTAAFGIRRLNSFRACDGKMASQAFDEYIGSFGVRGITASNGAQTQRIDERIQDFCVNRISRDNFERTFCERSYDNRRWWTLYNAAETTSDDIDHALIFDQDSSSWSTYTTNLNCLGYAVNSNDFLVSDFSVARGMDWTCQDPPVANKTTQEFFFQDNSEVFVGGGIDGFVYVLESGSTDILGADGSFIPYTGKLFSAGWNPFKASGNECQMNYVDLLVDTNESATAKVMFYKDSSQNPYATQNIDFLPPLGYICTLQGITNSNPASVNAFNHGLTTGDIIYIYLVEGMLEINQGPYTVTVVDSNNFTLDGIDSTSFGTYTANGGLYRQEFYREKIWRRVYAAGIGNEHRLQFQSTGTNSDFVIHAMRPFFKQLDTREIN